MRLATSSRRERRAMSSESKNSPADFIVFIPGIEGRYIIEKHGDNVIRAEAFRLSVKTRNQPMSENRKGHGPDIGPGY